MTYIENALYDFIKSILTRGYRTLKNPRYLPYSIFLLIVVFVSTTTAFVSTFSQNLITDEFKNLLLFIELSAAVAFLIVGLIFGRLSHLLQMLIIVGVTTSLGLAFWLEAIPQGSELAILLSAMFYIFWIAITALSAFGIFKDMFDNEIVGTILFLGKPEDDGRVLFTLIGWLIVFINAGLGYMIYGIGSDDGSISLQVTGLIIIMFSVVAALPLFNIQRKYDVFWTILTLFFMFASIRVLLLAFRAVTDTSAETSFWDTLFSLFIALYTIQYAAARGIQLGKSDMDLVTEADPRINAEEETRTLGTLLNQLFTDRGTILIILGIVIGYHTMQVQTIFGRRNVFQYIRYTEDADIVLLGYEVYLASALFIYIVVMIIFMFLPPIRSYLAPEIKRIPWAPPYTDLKLLVSSIKDGEISWKGDMAKLVTGLAYDKLKSKFGKNKSEGRIRSTLGKLITRAKDKDEES